MIGRSCSPGQRSAEHWAKKYNNTEKRTASHQEHSRSVFRGRGAAGIKKRCDNTNAPIIQLDFESYIGYSVINESFTSWDDYERFEGKKTFRIYSKSRFLDYISNATFASVEYPGPYLHYGIVCLDHIVNVVTISEPKVREIHRQ